MKIEAIDQGFTPATDTTVKSWPTCARCTEKVGEAMCMELNERPTYPVEGYGLEADRPRKLGCKFRVVVNAECHGMKQSAGFDVPEWWSDGFIQDAIAQLVFFSRSSAMPTHNIVERIK